MKKELSNDQRARLEQIARDEFRMRQGEINQEKQAELNAYRVKEEKKMNNSVMFKDFLKANKKVREISNKLAIKGFNINSDCNGVQVKTGNYGGKKHKGYEAMSKKCTGMSSNQHTRALNEVLSVIWSMEKPFSECINLIKSTIKKMN